MREKEFPFSPLMLTFPPAPGEAFKLIAQTRSLPHVERRPKGFAGHFYLPLHPAAAQHPTRSPAPFERGEKLFPWTPSWRFWRGRGGLQGVCVFVWCGKCLCAVEYCLIIIINFNTSSSLPPTPSPPPLSTNRCPTAWHSERERV